MRLYLFDDDTARQFEPFALTRPIGELLFGTMTLRKRSERALGLRCAGAWAGPALVGFEEPGAPEGLAWEDLETPCVLLNSRVVLETGTLPGGFSGALTVGGKVAGMVGAEGSSLPGPVDLLAGTFAEGRSTHALGGSWIESVWDLMERNEDRIRADASDGWGDWASAARLSPGVHRLGDGLLALGEDVTCEPGVVFDTRGGPILVEQGVSLQGPLRLAGPTYVGAGTTLFGGSISGSSIGPVCKLRGEIETSVILGYSNKAHDGFLGHAVLGRWVNLGALTTNSDLKNDYGHVRLRLPSGDVDTGQSKVGCFLGDHVKTGIGTMLNTGTVVGAGSNLFGGRMPPNYVPAFSWGSGDELVEFRFDKFAEVASTVMARRGLEFTPNLRTIFEGAWETTRSLRGAGR